MITRIHWIFLCIIILVAQGLAGAQEIDEHTAKNAGRNFLYGRTGVADARAGFDLTLVYKATSVNIQGSNSQPLFYVFNTTLNDGFVVVSANENIMPILAYSNEGGFDPGNIPPPVAQWLENYRKEIQYLGVDKAEPAAEVRKAWLSLKDRTFTNSSARETQVVKALIQTKWRQDSYYKAFCPQNSVTGCVATAMAQVMKYWSYPAHGTGSHTYHHKTYGTLSANFEETVYPWDKMQNSVNSKNDAVATLMYQCGVSVNMNYSLSESGAYTISANSPRTNCAEYALKTYFGYKSTLRGIQRENYSEAQWTGLLKKELDAGRPVIYTGFNSVTGHTFICDGYDDNGYFHFNWGWGAYDGYFYINELTPKKNQEGYVKEHVVIIGIEPAGEDVAEVISSRIKVYPNPAGSVVSIFLQEFDGVVQAMTITDSRGLQVFSTGIDSMEKLEFSTDDLTDGLYILRFQSDRGPLSMKIVIKK